MSKESEDIPVEAEGNESAPSETAVSQEAEIIEEATHRVSWLSIALALMAMLGTGGAAWFGWNQLVIVQQQAASASQQIARFENRIVAIERTAAEVAGLQAELSTLRQQITRTEDRNQALLNRVESVAEALTRAQVDTRTSYTLAEAEYLLKIADQRLLVERNPDTAQTLMRTAQGLLGQLEDGRLLPVREALAQDIQALDRVNTVDTLGIQAELLALDAALDDLTLPIRRLADDPDSGQDRLPETADDVLNTLQQFIRIREVDAPIAPLVTASDAGRAREILRLNLEQIKVALIREDQRLFDAGVAQAIRLTRHYFSVQEGAGASVLSALTALQETPVVQDIPEAATGLRALKRYRESLLANQAMLDEVSE